ncbi:hypothetical protein BJ170DRAFT_600461 [Xylariales sp. AK1849]|nr:hypothetical protein BJ170DRAFT_600461 [Xylariales sp. AK1849]
MPFQTFRRALGLAHSKRDLLDRAGSLETSLGATGWDQSLNDVAYWCPKLARIAADIELSAPLGPSSTPFLLSPVCPSTPCASSLTLKRTPTGTLTRRVPLYQEELPQVNDENDTALATTQAGYELACYLRARDFLVLHVLPNLVPILPDVGCYRTSILIKLLGSLIYNLLVLVPATTPSSSALNKKHFEDLQRGDKRSFEAGLEMLAALPSLDIAERRKLVVVVDAVDTAEIEETREKVGELSSGTTRILEIEPSRAALSPFTHVKVAKNLEMHLESLNPDGKKFISQDRSGRWLGWDSFNLYGRTSGIIFGPETLIAIEVWAIYWKLTLALPHPSLAYEAKATHDPQNIATAGNGEIGHTVAMRSKVGWAVLLMAFTFGP